MATEATQGKHGGARLIATEETQKQHGGNTADSHRSNTGETRKEPRRPGRTTAIIEPRDLLAPLKPRRRRG